MCGSCVERGLVGGSRWPVFITQFPVLHDVKKTLSFLHDIAKSLGRFLPGCPFQLAYGALGCPCKLFSSEGALWFPPRPFPSLYSSSNIKVRQSLGNGIPLCNGEKKDGEEGVSHDSLFPLLLSRANART